MLECNTIVILVYDTISCNLPNTLVAPHCGVLRIFGYSYSDREDKGTVA